MKAFRFRIRTFLVVVAVLTALLQWVVIPAWDFYSLPPATRSALIRLQGTMRTPPAGGTLIDFLKAVRLSSPDGTGLGIPLYVDPAGLKEAGTTIQAPLGTPPGRGSIAIELGESLRPLGLGYYVEDGMLTVTSEKAAARVLREKPRSARRR